MKKRVLLILLLCSMFFNVSHAIVFNVADHCEHTEVKEFVLETQKSNNCGDICDFHHILHQSVIPNTFSAIFFELKFSKKISYFQKIYQPPFLKPSYKPPKK
ncbi:hypothetical protein [Nitrosophilus labii]|uniref:hypothetical protein n=1 Tax=Nitrosophilus labii TaxID=2706014 RepID=UPI0016571BED|nr:hypothetical protein [Nitrosophilus labii]